PSVFAWPVSAKTETALSAQAARLLDHVHRHPDQHPAAIGHALATTRTHHPHRAVILGQNPDELHTALAALAQGDNHPGIITGTATPTGK
ncbi:hypothetical protein, partial [Streptomyces malaysiense]|uniref:CurL C-terminal domain-containing protein n=1 Tax=Streptomyces malaysiense TaxID=1428626 RepID=UPI00142DBFF7